jgi:RNA polymerase sigma factor (TIGR02999 family)
VEQGDRPPTGVTQLLIDWGKGDPTALDRLLPLVYAELRRVAARALQRERPGHTLQPTALVHEAYLRLVDSSNLRIQDRAHFLAIACRVMRQILVDHARTRGRAKRGGGQTTIVLEPPASTDCCVVDLIALDTALTTLTAIDPQQGRIVELRFFGGLTVEEAAEVVGISPATLKREWSAAKAWLYRELHMGNPS